MYQHACCAFYLRLLASQLILRALRPPRELENKYVHPPRIPYVHVPYITYSFYCQNLNNVETRDVVQKRVRRKSVVFTATAIDHCRSIQARWSCWCQIASDSYALQPESETKLTQTLS